MALATNTGLVDDQDILQNERVIDMDETIAMLDPDVSQFMTMLMRVARSVAESTKVEWLEDQLFPRLSSVASGGASDGATITVATGEGAYFRAGDIVRNAKTGVAFRVVSVSGDVLTITNALGRVAFSAHTAGDQLLITGNASAQGATLGTRGRSPSASAASARSCTPSRHAAPLKTRSTSAFPRTRISSAT